MYHCIFVFFVSWHTVGRYLNSQKKSKMNYTEVNYLFVTKKRSCSNIVDRISGGFVYNVKMVMKNSLTSFFCDS